MPTKDPTDAIRRKAATLAEVTEGESCNQSSFKVGKGAFLYIGPGAKGQGFKAMFKLKDSMAQAKKLAAEQPDRIQTGSTGWVTARFTSEKPLASSIWEPWLNESYYLSNGAGTGSKAKQAVTRKRKTSS